MKRSWVLALVLLSAPVLSAEAPKYQTADQALAAKDYPAAVKLLRKDARRNDLEAAYKLGVMFRDGRGIPASPRRALRWFKHASKPDLIRARNKKGLPDAQYALARMYLDGVGTERDPSEAAKWLERAAEQDHGEAQLALAKLYLSGEGVRRNYASAYQLAGQAQANLTADQAEAITKVQEEAAKHLSPNELAELKQKTADKAAGPQPL